MTEPTQSVNLPLISDLEPALAESLNRFVTFVELADKEVLFNEGDEADYMFTVVSGCLRVLRRSEGRDVYVRDLPPGESGGITSIFLTKPRSATVIADGKTCIARLSQTDLENAIKEDGELAHGLMQILCKQVRSGGRALADILRDDNDGRLNVAVFDAKKYDVDALVELVPEEWNMRYFDPRLNDKTASLAAGCRVACIFVNDVADRAALELLASAGVELIALRCSGFNNVDLQAARQLGISVVRVPAYSPNAVSEHAVALLLALNRKVHRAYQRVREGNFTLVGLEGFDLNGRTAAVLGVGAIGKCLVRNLQGFGMKVYGWDAFPDEKFAAETGMEYVAIDEAITRADVVSLHTPLMESTYHLIDEQAIDSMKDGVIIINTSRGGLIDHEALIAGLKSGKVAAAGLDVYEAEAGVFFEDLSSSVLTDDVLARLLSLTNVIITSHQAYLTTDALATIARVTINNIKEFTDGKTGSELTNIVLPEK